VTAKGEVARTWTVGELADEFGVTTRTLRFYEAEGLIAPRRVGTSRVYAHRDRARLVLILRGRRFGMSLAEIAGIVDMYDGAVSSERRQLATLLERLGAIDADLRARQSDLRRTLAEVQEVAGQCRARLLELDRPARAGSGRKAGSKTGSNTVPMGTGKRLRSGD
jgi:DNA-binding transcriptional MerR regulator